MSLLRKRFVFKTQFSLVMLTGLRASNLLELKDGLKSVPESSVYHHTHHFLQQHQFLIPEPPNDFAYWVTNILREPRVGERLAAIDTVRFRSLNDLRAALVSAMDDFLKTNPVIRPAASGEEFNFMKCISFDLPTSHMANNLEEFVDCLKKVGIHSIYYHMFEGRMRTTQGANDFSLWFRDLGENRLAQQVENLDPYTQTLEGLRTRLIKFVQARIAEESYATVG